MYNYLESMKEDIKQYIEENINIKDYESQEDAEEKLHDELWTEDSVTGNASGSYTFNRELAKSYVMDNLDLLKESAQAFCCKDRAEKWLFDEAFEDADVTIRCYLLTYALNEVLDEFDFED